MRRRLFTLLSALSLVLCAGTCVLWVRSYEEMYALAVERFEVAQDLGGDTIPYEPGDVGWNLQRELAGYRGTIGLHQLRLCPGNYVVPKGPKPAPGWHFDGYFEASPYKPPIGLHWKVVAARCDGPKGDRADAEFRAGCPMWMVALAAALIPGLRLGLWLKRARRAGIGVCPVCGYDLRATPAQCPECGAAPAIAK